MALSLTVISDEIEKSIRPKPRRAPLCHPPPQRLLPLRLPRSCRHRHHHPAPPASHRRWLHPLPPPSHRRPVSRLRALAASWLPPTRDACCVTAAAAASPRSFRLPPPGTLRAARTARDRRRMPTVRTASVGATVSGTSASAVAVGSWCAGAGAGVGVEELRAELSAAPAAHQAWASAPTTAAGAASPRGGTFARGRHGSEQRRSYSSEQAGRGGLHMLASAYASLQGCRAGVA